MNPKQIAVTQQTPTRPPSADEQQFFDRSGVPAYAADDGSVVFDGYNKYLDVNESARQMMRSGTPYLGRVPMTDEQAGQFDGPYADNTEHGQHSMIARVMSGDPSAMQPTDAQKLAAERLFAEALLSE